MDLNGVTFINYNDSMHGYEIVLMYSQWVFLCIYFDEELIRKPANGYHELELMLVL